MQPLLSIITINLNNREGLRKTIESVVAQTAHNFEYIIIDGGSVDGSKELIESYGPSIAYWQSRKDKGIYNAMNQGIDHAKGEFCLFLNAGDYLLKEGDIDDFLPYLPKYDLVCGNILFDGVVDEIAECLPQTISLDFMYFASLWHPATFIRTALFKKFGKYNEEFRIAADYDFFLKLIADGGIKIKTIDNLFAAHQRDGISSLPKFQRLNQQERRWAQKTHLSRKTRRNLAFHYWLQLPIKQKCTFWVRKTKVGDYFLNLLKGH